LTVDEPTVVGQVSVPVGVASSTTSLYVAPKRGSVVGSSNARTQISLANNATTTVQNIAAYDAGELTGWVSITATTPLRFYVAAQFSKNGAANNYNVSYQVSGDTPPAGFVVTATAAGLLQVTLPSITGFASASINFALNAPSVGTSFPLSISARSVIGDISGTAVPAGYVGELPAISSVTAIAPGASGAYKSVTSITVNKGIYLVFAKLDFELSATGITGLSAIGGGISTQTNALDTNQQRVLMGTSVATNADLTVSPRYFSVSSDNTSFYLVSRIDYSSLGTAKVGGLIYAVRIA
jgi:hypothetical protein